MSKNFGQFTQASDISDTDKVVGHAGTASGAERGFLWSLIKSKLKTYFDTLYAAAAHTHAQSDITNLVTDLAGKAASSHTHAQSDVTNLVTDLAGKQPLATVLTNTTASFTTAQESKLAGIESSADVTDAGNVGSAIHGATGKTTPVDADTLPLIDSEASNVLKKLTWANLKATLKTYFDTLYAAVSHTHAQSDITNLVTDLAGKAASSHTHAQSDVTNLVTDLAAKQPIDTAATLSGTGPTLTLVDGHKRFDLALTGNTTVTLAGFAAGRSADLFITGDSVLRTLLLQDGSAVKPKWLEGEADELAANKVMEIHIECRGNAVTDCFASYGVEL